MVSVPKRFEVLYYDRVGIVKKKLIKHTGTILAVRVPLSVREDSRGDGGKEVILLQL